MKTLKDLVNFADLWLHGNAAPAQFRILVVEDDRQGADTLRRLVSHYATQVKVVQTVEAAEVLLVGDTYDIALVDLNLPEADTTRLIERFKTKVAMIAYAANRRDRRFIKALMSGATECLDKGCTSVARVGEVLTAAVQKKVNSHQATREHAHQVFERVNVGTARWQAS